MASKSDRPSEAEPLRVHYATGRMLGADDFAAEQTYHRGRLARTLQSAVGTGTVSGLKVTVHDDPTPALVELRVSPGIAIDRAGRMIDMPFMVCIRLEKYLNNHVNELSDAFKDDAIVADVFVSYLACPRGKTPSFATADDYDATDAFVSNRMLDSFSMQLILRKEADPPLPVDPWAKIGPLRPPGDGTPDPTDVTVKRHILDADFGPAEAPVEYPNLPDAEFDRTAVFLARVKIAATRLVVGRPPTADLTKVDVDNESRLFLYPGALVARWVGLTTGKV